VELAQIPAADVVSYVAAQEALEIALDENETDGTFASLCEFVAEEVWKGGIEYDLADEIAHNTVSGYYARNDLQIESPFD
jgi:hypothetical protein